MYKFKHAVRTETENNWSLGILKLLKEPLPDRIEYRGSNEHGRWFSVQLPASVIALAVVSEIGITCGVFHSPAMLRLELEEGLNAHNREIKV